MIYQPEIRRVVLVVLDGLRADAIPALGLRCWQQLANSGASSLCGTTVAPSVTAAAMASLFTGAPPEVHGLRSDRFHLPRRRGTLHPLPQVLAAAGMPTSCFIRRLPLVFRFVSRRLARFVGTDVFSFSGRNCREILFAAWDQLLLQERGLIFLHWPDADFAGHEHGWMSDEYARAAHRMDQALGLLAALADVERDPGTLLIALADHGGGGMVPRDHDSDHPLDRTIPLLLAGPEVCGDELEEPSLLDVPATVLWALGVPRPESFTGRPLYEAFAPSAAAVARA
ncbi:MAG: alkaline phosphatase family protein [Thermoanaerobaculia bacterium]